MNTHQVEVLIDDLINRRTPVGDNTPNEEVLVRTGLTLLGEFLIDIKRIADALEKLQESHP